MGTLTSLTKPQEVREPASITLRPHRLLWAQFSPFLCIRTWSKNILPRAKRRHGCEAPTASVQVRRWSEDQSWDVTTSVAPNKHASRSNALLKHHVHGTPSDWDQSSVFDCSDVTSRHSEREEMFSCCRKRCTKKKKRGIQHLGGNDGKSRSRS